MTAKAGPAVPANHTDVQQTRYSRTPDGAFPYLDRSKNTQGDGDTVLVAIVFVILLIVLMLTYFALFIYQRIRFPQHGPEDNFELVRRESRNQYPDSVNQVITKDELFSKGGLMDVGYDACRTEAVHAATKFEQDRIQTKRDILSDVQSVVSQETDESTRLNNDFPTREETNEVEDGPEKISVPSSGRGRVRLSIEVPQAALTDDPYAKQTLSQAQQERKRMQYQAEFAEAYQLTVRREGRIAGQHRMSPLSNFIKHSW